MFLAVLQARMSSTRLPGKVLAPIVGKPMILLQLERLSKCRTIDKLVVATSEHASDDALVDVLEDNNIEYFRGSLTDVLSRFTTVGELYNPEFVIRLTADCPLTDPSVIEALAHVAQESNADYTSNCFPRTYPRGLDAEIIRWPTLQALGMLELTDFEREHVCVRLYENPELYSQANLSQAVDMSNLRWTVDTPEDMEFVKFVYGSLYSKNPDFTTSDILKLLTEFPKRMHFEVDE